MIKNKKIAFVLFLALVIVFWNVLDYLYAALIVHSEYTFSAGADLLRPLAAGIVVGYLLFLRKR